MTAKKNIGCIHHFKNWLVIIVHAMQDLFLLASKAMQEDDPTQPYSYNQLAKIHGMPFGPWNGVQSSVWDPKLANKTVWWAGHCVHGTTLLGPWHR
jgi:tyrosinase